MANAVHPHRHAKEIFFDDLIVSRPTLPADITYVNDVSARIVGILETEDDRPSDSIIRDPDMPRAVFKLLWDTILRPGARSSPTSRTFEKTGDFYWVFAQV